MHREHRTEHKELTVVRRVAVVVRGITPSASYLRHCISLDYQQIEKKQIMICACAHIFDAFA